MLYSAKGVKRKRRFRVSLKVFLILVALVAIPAGLIGRRISIESQRKNCLEKLFFSNGDLAGYFLHGPANYAVDFSHDAVLQRELGRSPPTISEHEASNIRCLFQQPDYSQAEFSGLPPMGTVFARSQANLVPSQGLLDHLFPATWQTNSITFVSTKSFEPGGAKFVVEALAELPSLEGVVIESKDLKQLSESPAAKRIKCIVLYADADLDPSSFDGFESLLALKILFFDPSKTGSSDSLRFLEKLENLRILDVRDQWSRVHKGHAFLRDPVITDISRLKELRSLTLSGKFSAEAISSLSDSGQLKELRLINCAVSSHELTSLANLTQLDYLSIYSFDGPSLNDNDAEWPTAFRHLDYMHVE